MASSSQDRRWKSLLFWLKTEHGMNVENELLVETRDVKGYGRGLFASRRCRPSTTLFTVPAKALININTLRRIYAPKFVSDLTAVQQISMHLLLHRPREDDDALDPAYGPFISTMPRDFDSHPLTWLVKSKDFPETVIDRPEERLLKMLPPSPSRALNRLYKRFMDDWTAVYKLLQMTPEIVATSSRSEFSITSSDLLMDYLWAWLNVNTRCIYYAVRDAPSDPDNLTLCPILDFANHTDDRAQIIATHRKDRIRIPGSQNNADDYKVMSYPDENIAKGEQLFLRYGGHSNTMLFVEYGFAICFEDWEVTDGIFRGEVDVQDLVEDLIMKDPVGPYVKTVLEDEGYWGDWTLDSSPPPGHPSYRLIIALRLYHVMKELSDLSLPQLKKGIQPWMDVMGGGTEIVSAENERRWRRSLLGISEAMLQRAKKGLPVFGSAAAYLPSAEWVDWMEENVATLWREEWEVAEAIISSVKSGEEF